MKITANQVTESRDVPHTFGTFASDLGWKPGYFPQFVDTDLGNGQRFSLRMITQDCAVYVQEWGVLSLSVYND